MPYVVVLQVKIDPEPDAAHHQSEARPDAVADVTGMAGFQLASWLNDGKGTGVCLFEFDVEEHARSALALLTPPGGPMPIGSGVFAIELEAAG